jgi:Capsule polysaccharide biosynthesis protein
MKSESSQPLVLRLGRLWRKIQFRGREGKCLLRAVSKAKRAQRTGQDATMRQILSHASAAVESIKSNGRTFARDWQSLLRFQLAVFDLAGAEETARRARQSGLPDSPAVLEQVIKIGIEMADWKDLLEDARLSMQDGWTAKSAAGMVIFVPSTAMVPETTQQPGLRAGLRLVFGEILKTCRAEGIPFEVRGRLANHGAVAIEDGSCYISHHTKSDREGGLHIKVTDLPSCFSFDTRGYSGWSKFAQTSLEDLRLDRIDFARANEFVQAMRQRIIGGNVSKYQQVQAGGAIELPERYVFLGLQVIDDAVQALAKLPMLEMLAEVAATCRQQHLSLVVKRHPRCNSAAVSKALASGLKANDFQLSDASIHDLIARSCAVCVVNSSVGAEALLHGKPVYVFGESEYQHVCYRIRAKGEFGKQFKPDMLPVSSDDLTRYLYVLRNEYAVDATQPATAGKFIHDRVVAHFNGQTSPG